MIFNVFHICIQAKETVEEVEKTHEEVFRERVHQVCTSYYCSAFYH